MGVGGGLAAPAAHGGFCDSFQLCGSKKANKFCVKSVMSVQFDLTFASLVGTG